MYSFDTVSSALSIYVWCLLHAFKCACVSFMLLKVFLFFALLASCAFSSQVLHTLPYFSVCMLRFCRRQWYSCSCESGKEIVLYWHRALLLNIIKTAAGNHLPTHLPTYLSYPHHAPSYLYLYPPTYTFFLLFCRIYGLLKCYNYVIMVLYFISI